MRYLLLSDIHGNLEALEATLTAAARRAYDRVLVLGDLVGYGADPNRVIERVRALEPAAIIRGNHDKVASGLDDGESFNQTARSAVQWTLETLTPEHREWLHNLPTGPLLIDETVEICHGAPFDEDAYIFDELDALRAFEVARRPVCLFGHTHVPVVYCRTEDKLDVEAGYDSPEVRVGLDPKVRYLINPGSVGQPRDGDPRASSGIVDTDAREVWLYRVPYDIQLAQRKVMDAGLPDVLARRLAVGR